jgi:hypothetical protein
MPLGVGLDLHYPPPTGEYDMFDPITATPAQLLARGKELNLDLTIMLVRNDNIRAVIRHLNVMGTSTKFVEEQLAIGEAQYAEADSEFNLCGCLYGMAMGLDIETGRPLKTKLAPHNPSMITVMPQVIRF